MENKENQLVPINNSLISIERQISIGEKVLGISLSELEKDKIKKLLIKVVNENYNILSIICEYISLPEKTIEKYKHKLNWSSLCCNENIKWNEYLINKYYNSINLDSIIENKKIDFNYQMYLKYEDKISLDTLNYVEIDLPKEFVKKNKEILEWDNFFPWTFENFEYFEHEIDWQNVSKSKNIELNDSIIKKYHNLWKWDEVIKVENSKNETIYFRIFGIYYTNLIFNENSYIDDFALSQIKNINVWVHLSRDMKNIDEYLIEKYANYWNWDLLSINNSISWTFELVEKFKDKINWRVFSLNPNVVWNDLFIEKFENYINWDYIGLNTKLPWNIDFFLKYKNKINPQFLFFINNCEVNNDEFYKSNRDIGDYFVDYHYNVKLDKNNFDIKLIEYFKERLNWDMISGHYFLEKKDIEQYKNYISWRSLSWNREIKWDKELLETYIDHWDWELILRNKLIKFEMFNYKLLREIIEFIEVNDLFQTRYPSIWFRNYFISITNQDDVEMILNEI